MVLLLLTLCLLLLPLWESVIVLCFVVRYFMSILVLQSSSWGRELVALLNLSFWCLVMVERLFLAVPRGCLQFVIVVFPDHTHLLFLVGPLLMAYAISTKYPWTSPNIELTFFKIVKKCLLIHHSTSVSYIKVSIIHRFSSKMWIQNLKINNWFIE